MSYGGYAKRHNECMAVQDPVKWFRRQSAPATVVLCILLSLGAIVGTFTPKLAMANLAFDGSIFPRVWSLLTYPFIDVISIFFIFKVMWIYWVGSMLEYDLSTRKFSILWIIASAVGILPLAIFKAPAVGMLIPGAILMSIWGTRNPNMTIMVFMIVPVAAKWIAALTVIGVFLFYGGASSMPLVGLAAVSGCIVGFLYARNMIPNLSYGKGSVTKRAAPTRAEKAKQQAYYDDVYRREKEREEKERLRKLFEGSLEDKK
jgi:membrane associated rhomboid family serine protease